MMEIQDKNEIIAQITFNSIKKMEGNLKTLNEFGYFTYYITFDQDNNFCMGFQSEDFNKIYEYSGKTYIENEFKDYIIAPNEDLGGKKWPIVLKAPLKDYDLLNKKKKDLSEEEKKQAEELKKEKKDLSEEEKKQVEELKKKLENYAKVTSEKFSLFRVKLYASVIQQMLEDVKNKKPTKLFSYHLNRDNILYILPSEDRVELIYGITFLQDTDISLAKVFLQELEEAKRHVKNCLDAKVYVKTDKDIPNDITKIDLPGNYSNGLVVFNLYIKDITQIVKKLNYFVNFRQYIQFHIHSIKTFLHIRMNRKGKEIENKLNSCKIVPDEYIKKLETLNFYVALKKKDEQQKLFATETKKINV